MLTNEIKKLRQDKGLTQQKLAELARMSIAAITAIEQGRTKTLHPKTLKKLEKVLNK